MSETATVDAGQEKKEEAKKEDFPERITFRHWLSAKSNGGKEGFTPDQKDVPARFRQKMDQQKKNDLFLWDFTPKVGGKPSVGSEIVDQKDGTVWVVEKVEGANPYLCRCTKKEPPKDAKKE